ncbi:MAG: hypothetical protein Q8N15_05160, partial [Bacillota bacterium]|nr:hypothetical protein [Bacillota bacterium]
MSRLTLTNGKSVVKPFNRIWIVLAVVVILGLIFGYIIKLDSEGISFKPDQLPIILKKMFSPHRGDTWADYFAYIPKLQNVLIMTLEMCYGGTVIGSVLAIPTALLSSRNIVKSKWIYGPARFLLNLFRTIPVTVLAVISIGIVGIVGGS